MQVRVTRDEVGFTIWRKDKESESVEKVLPSVGDKLLHDKIKSFGLAGKTERLLNQWVSTPVAYVLRETAKNNMLLSHWFEQPLETPAAGIVKPGDRALCGWEFDGNEFQGHESAVTGVPRRGCATCHAIREGADRREAQQEPQ